MSIVRAFFVSNRSFRPLEQFMATGIVKDVVNVTTHRTNVVGGAKLQVGGATVSLRENENDSKTK